MTSDLKKLQIQRVDARDGSAAILQQLREKLSPQGDVVSPRGRALTKEVFGKPLTPVQVVQTICDEVQSEGTAAVLRFCKALDKAEFPPKRSKRLTRTPILPCWIRCVAFETTWRNSSRPFCIGM